MNSRFMLFVALGALLAAGCSTQAPTAVDTAGLESRDVASGAQHLVPDEHLRRNFRTHLSGGNEVPPVESRAQGQAIFQVVNDPPEIHYKLMVANIRDVTGGHIHLAPAGQNGPVVVNLLGPPPGPGRRQGVLVEGVITGADVMGMPLPALLEAMSNGGAYVNVHTVNNPGGEIRGQIQ